MRCGGGLVRFARWLGRLLGSLAGFDELWRCDQVVRDRCRWLGSDLGVPRTVRGGQPDLLVATSR